MIAPNGPDPIPTVYRGITFRSRIEGRWSVFFDELHIHWEYEPEGFELSPQRRYLPDFFLPDIGPGGSYFEVKGDTPTEAERRRCQDLSTGTRKRVFLAVRAPFPPQLQEYRRDGSIFAFWPDGAPASGYAFFECEKCRRIDIGPAELAYGCECIPDADTKPTETPMLLAAYAAARAERFGVFEPGGRAAGRTKHSCGSSDVILVWQTFADRRRHIREECAGCGMLLSYAPQTPANVSRTIEPSKKPIVGGLFDGR